MAENSPIEWTDRTWSPWEGCTKVSPGCDHCYAEGMNRWLRKGANWGPGAPRRTYSDKHWQKPSDWNDAAQARTEVLGPGERIKVFPSVCDPFDNAAPDGARARFAALILGTPHLTWLLLTKRIGNAAGMLAEMFPAGTPENVWLGATIVNQEEADRDIPKLLATPARVRFLSMEPLLGPVDVSRFLWPVCGWWKGPHNSYAAAKAAGAECGLKPQALVAAHRMFVNWVIVGGESGHGARPAQLAWMRSIVQQCRAAGVPVLVKQLGREVLDDGMSSPGEHWPAGMVRRPIPRRDEGDPGFAMRLKHAKGGDWSEWPEDLRVREFPEVR